MKQEQMIDDIVAMLDQQVAGGTGHVNLEITDNAEAGKM
mgnify:FL=1